ncbi:M4 family metallopeptidase [Ruminococcus sp.]|uniref:M4 family metallopeptidase n=1 Tax=Ruminococcus sp. TaxID=41978 RepID=UPI002E8234A5|nr:M4 family metallopeptidase [Ruminococcus sp.]MEE3491949.1 M4 family metallopeptidase [Ruminococcus sp.]
MKKSMKKMISILLAVVMVASMFSVLPLSASAAVFENYAYTQTTNSDGFVNTFISEPFCDDKITDEEAAYNCVMSVIDRIGGSSSTELELDYIQPNENGMTVVSYSQRAGQMLVYGSTVKLIVDKDDNAIGLVSSISPDVEVKPIEEWAVSQTQAEKIVTDQIAASGSEGTVLEGDSERAVIPSMTQIGRFICVWVVYTYDISKGMDDYAYKAHYVTAEGEYLYSVSVSNPSDPDALSGQSAKELFDFDAYESGETQVTVNGAGGSTKEVTVPTLKDTKTGKVYLADRERKIVCADTADMFFRNTLTPTEAVNVHPVDASVYYNYIRVWDYYKSVGWTGPDGKGTPTLLLMNYVDQTGKPVANACYLTKMNGFQLFAWTREMNFGACLDVVGHEFTHCVTTSTMKYNIYKNDPGAINEGYSDIMGSLIEIRLDGETEGSWKIAENLGAPIRNMADPHEYAQPEFAFDTYYAPNASVPTGANDKGGVHINASLLALCAVKLHEAGMTPREQSYFWLNSALVISPQTDYPMMAEILPWLMKQLGYDKYLDTLNQTIKDAKFTATEASAELPEGCGAATFDFSDYADLAEKGRVNIFFFKSPEFDINKRSGTWPVPGSTVAQATLPAGEYVVLVGLASPDGATVKRGILTEEGWKFCEDITPDYFAANGKTVTVNEGETTVVPNDGFRPVAVEILNIVDPDYVLPEPQPEPEVILLGDVDGDGVVDVTDATLIQRYDVEMVELADWQLKAADVDGDGEVTILDVTWIQRYIAEMKAPEGIGKPVTEVYTTKSVPVLRSSLDSTETATLRVYADQPNVPYMNVTDFYNQFYTVDTDIAEAMTFTQNGGVYTITNFCGDAAVIDVNANTFTINNADRFTMLAYDLKNVASGGTDENYPFIKVNDTTDPEEPTPVVLSLSDYDITLRGDETGVYAPVSTLGDIFASTSGYYIVSAGEKIYVNDKIGDHQEDNAMEKDPDYLMAIKKDRPDDLVTFTYHELCLGLDLWYGQPGQEFIHNDLLNGKMNEVLTNKYPEIKEMLLANDFETFYTGLNHIFYGLLFDGGHTGMNTVFQTTESSLFTPVVKDIMTKDYGQSMKYFNYDRNSHLVQRKETREAVYNGDWYAEQGDTAMIRFDHFDVDNAGWKAFYAGTGARPLKYEEDGDEMFDTVGVILSGLERAKQNPAIKNIIIDVSCNGGGNDSALKSIEWLFTGTSYVLDNNKITKQFNKSYGVFDMNFDGVFDDRDVSPYTDYHYGVLTADYSFSCGNAFPCFMHDRGAMILGQKSYGGACAIRKGSVGGIGIQCSAATSATIFDDGSSVDFGCPVDADLTTDGENPYENFYDLSLISQKMNEFFAAG